ncbi:MAG: hypothetical protein O8C62_01020 [Candidatus Methanoperedens sp.]|nr:hypothetical protein [Candidatus Methanoperedens sp.]
MGLFNFLKYNNIEKALLNDYSQRLSKMGISSTEAKRVCLVMGMPHLPNDSMAGISSADAKKMTEDMLDQAIEESKKGGTYYLPQNLGDIILGDAGSDNPPVKKIAESIRQKLPKIKKEGVRDEDVRWWWNLNDIERRIILKQENIARMTLFMSELEKSNESSKEKAAAKAAEKVRKFHPMYDPIYGEPDDISHTTGDDKSLPCELKNRINIYIEKRAGGNLEKYKNEIEESSTFNALIRKEIKAGNL